MAWFMVDDQLALHKKVCEAGNAAMGLWVRAGAWSMQNLTEGFVSTAAVKALGTTGQAKALVMSKLWVKVEGGYQFHEWGTRQLSAEQIAERRRKRAEAGSKGGKASGESRNAAKGEANASAKPEQISTHVLVPVPSVVAFGGELTQVSRFCPAHPEGTPKPCPACADARRAYEAQQQAQQQNELAKRRAHRAAINACPVCDENGMRSAPGGLKHCAHQEEAHA